MSVTLSTVTPDFADLLSQLQSQLGALNSWKDILPSGTGETLTEFVAGVGAMNQYAIERAAQECFLETANAAVSVYALARLLGVHVQRKQGAQVGVNINSPDTAQAWSLPAFTPFQINGQTNVYSTQAISIPANDAVVAATLVEGLKTTHTFTADGTSFQRYTVGSDFSSDDMYYLVNVGGVAWTEVQGLWTAMPGDQVFFTNTTADGQLEVVFGNGVTGKIPGNGVTIQITEFVTQGTAGESTLSNLPVVCQTDSRFTGTTTTGLANASDVPTLDILRHTVPRLYAAGGRAVTRDDYDATVRKYPGILDTNVLGEYELGAGNVQWANTVGVVVLTQTPWTTTDQSTFALWLSKYAISTTYIKVILPTTVNIDVTMQIIVDSRFAQLTVENQVKTAINQLFVLGPGSLGRAYYRSDFIAAAMAVQGVKHVVLTAPAADISLGYSAYAVLNSLTLSTTY